MMETLQLGSITFQWLNGGDTYMDGGAMFGVVPKLMWSKKYPSNDLNQIELRTDPIYFEVAGKHFLIDAGIGNGKLSDKQKRNYGVTEESKLIESLAELSLTPKDIDYVLMTHMHFDHALGLTKLENDKYVSVFPNAKIITSNVEWDEMRNPNIRSKNTYWKQNWEAIEGQVETFSEEIVIKETIRMVHTGGHSDGHCIIKIESNGETLIHMADLMPTHAHQNVLWVLAYDDYPMTSIRSKEKWILPHLIEEAWFSFYHDGFYRAIKWNPEGKEIDAVKRVRPK
jgi:glyoxylase-like metal-dependent hydrolase (beta-lactamase superfamily II)